MDLIIKFLNRTRDKMRKNKIDILLKKFLSFLLEHKEKFYNELAEKYSDDELINEIIYSCALNTIDEYITQSERITIFDLFEENFRIRNFEFNGLTVELTESTLKIINQFECLKSALNDNQKNHIMQEVNNIIASTT